MAMTTLGDLFATTAAIQVALSFAADDPVQSLPFTGSGIVTRNPQFDAAAAGTSALIEVPFIGNLDSTVEPNYSNDVYEDVAIPHKLNVGFNRARKALLNEAWGAMSLVQELSGQDPLALVAARLDRFWAEQAENRIIASARGIYEVESGNADFNVTAAAADRLVDAIIDAELLTNGIDGYIMGTAAFSRLAKDKLATFERDPETNMLNRVFNGKPVIVSDRAMTNAAGESVIALLGRSAFGYGLSDANVVPLAYEREEARGNGGGAETLWTRKNMVVHPTGFDFTSAVITGNGTETVARSGGWADLINPVNWERAAPRSAIPMAFVTL